jgi:small-conductance mechanosensitive channel
MQKSKRSATNATRKMTGFIVQEIERSPIETKLDQLLVQTETIARDQAVIKDGLTQVKDSIENIKGNLEALKHQLPRSRSKHKVIIDLADSSDGEDYFISCPSTVFIVCQRSLFLICPSSLFMYQSKSSQINKYNEIRIKKIGFKSCS